MKNAPMAQKFCDQRRKTTFATQSAHSGLSGLSIIALRKDYSPSETRFGVETAESDFCPMGYIQAPSIKKTPHIWVLGL
jgi:hypothetical protein